MIYLGSSIPDEATALFPEIPEPDGNPIILTLVTDGMKITTYEDRTADLIDHHKDSAPIWYDRGEAHMLRIEYADND